MKKSLSILLLVCMLLSMFAGTGFTLRSAAEEELAETLVPAAEEEPAEEETPAEEEAPVEEEAPAEEEAPIEEVPAEEPAEEPAAEELPAETPAEEELPAEAGLEEEVLVEETPAEDAIPEESELLTEEEDAPAEDGGGINFTLVLYGGEVFRSMDPSTALTSEEKVDLGIFCTKGTATYTFNGVNFITAAVTAIQIMDTDATITLVGDNIIKSLGSATGTASGIMASDNGTLTIGGTGSLAVTAGTSTESNSFGILSYGSVVITGGTVTAVGGPASNQTSCGIYAMSALKISGGKVTANAGTGVACVGLECDEAMEVTGGTLYAKGGTQAISVISEPDAIAKITDTDTVLTTFENGTYKDANSAVATSVILTAKPPVATVKLGETGEETGYSSLDKAWAAAQAGTATNPATITLLADVTGNVTVESDDVITLDLNGYVLQGTGSGAVITNNGTLTIKDGSTDGRKHYFTVAEDTGLWTWNEDKATTENSVTGGVITGGTGTSLKSYTYGGGIYNNSSCTLTLEGGSIIGNTATCGGGVYNNGTLTAKGCTISGNTARSGGGVYSDGKNSFATLEDCTVTKNSSSYSTGGVFSFGTLILKNTNVTNNTSLNVGGVFIQNGKLTIIGGEISGNEETGGNGYGAGVCNYGSGSLTLGGDVVIYGNKTVIDQEKKESNIVGYAYNKKYPTFSIDTTDPLVDGAKIGISLTYNTGVFTGVNATDYSGYFTSDNTYYIIEQNAAGELEVAEPYVVNVDTNVGYKTVADALAADHASENAQPPTTLKINRDLKENVTIPADRNITLDLNGHVLDGSGKKLSTITNYGTLTIKDNDNDNTHAAPYADLPEGGVITGGTGYVSGSYSFGGGVYNKSSGTLTVTGGTITGNSADYGGGVYNDGAFSMTGGTIRGNTATAQGGGVYYWSKEGHYVKLSGAVTITGNTVDGKAANLCLSGETACSTVEIAGALTGSNIGVTTMVNDVSTAAAFTTNGTTEDLAYFTADNSTQYVQFVDGDTDYLAICDYGYVEINAKTVTVTPDEPKNEAMTRDEAISLMNNEAFKGYKATPVKYTKVVYDVSGDDYKYIKYDGSSWVDGGTLSLNDLKKVGAYVIGTTHEHEWNYSLKAETTDTLEAVCALGDADTQTLTISAYGCSYDGKAHGASLSAQTFGGEETLTITYEGTGSTSYEATTTAPTDAGTYKASITLTGSDSKKATAYVEFTISPKKLSVTDTTVVEKTYDGTTDATVKVGSVDGKVSGDDVTVTATGTFDDKNVGTKKNVTVTYALTGDKAGNYTAPDDATVKADVKAAKLTVTGSSMDEEMPYNGTTNALDYAHVGALEGVATADAGKVGVKIASAALKDKTIGLGKSVTVSYELTGDEKGNYVAPADTILSIDVVKKQLTVTGTTVANKKYDETCEATVTVGTLNGVIEGETVTLEACGNFDTADAGENKDVLVVYDITAGDFTNLANYLVPVQETLKATIEKADPVKAPEAEDVLDIEEEEIVKDGIKSTTKSITIEAMPGVQYYFSTSPDEPTETEWADAQTVKNAGDKLTFKDLDPNTEYYIYYRVAETENTEPSESAALVIFSKAENPEITEKTGFDKLTKGNVKDDASITIGEHEDDLTADNVLAVYVDGTELNEDQYKAETGCIKVTLYKSFLNTLKPGKHTLTVELYGQGYDDMVLETTFTIAKPKAPATPDTGDDSNVILWFCLLAFCGAATVLVSKKRKEN